MNNFGYGLSSSSLFSLLSIGSFVAGIAIGALYFGGLWLTIRSMSVVQQPALLFMVSFVVRMVVSIALFYWVMDDSVVQAFVCVAGLLVARTWLIQRWGPASQGVNTLWTPSA